MIEDYKCEVLPDDFPQYDLSFKIIVVGDSGVGKSCLTMKATKDYFEEFYSATVGFEFLTFNVKINDKYIKLQIWDTCGQEIYRSLVSSFYKNSSLAMIVYSIDNETSFANVNTWKNEIKNESNPEIKVFLIGNKSDLEEKRKVSKETSEQYYKQHQFDFFMETSAKLGVNAKNVFIEAAKVLFNQNMKYQDRLSRPVSMSMGIPVQKLPKPEDNHTVKETKKGCCS